MLLGSLLDTGHQEGSEAVSLSTEQEKSQRKGALSTLAGWEGCHLSSKLQLLGLYPDDQDIQSGHKILGIRLSSQLLWERSEVDMEHLRIAQNRGSPQAHCPLLSV